MNGFITTMVIIIYLTLVTGTTLILDRIDDLLTEAAAQHCVVADAEWGRPDGTSCVAFNVNPEGHGRAIRVCSDGSWREGAAIHIAGETTQ